MVSLKYNICAAVVVMFSMLDSGCHGMSTRQLLLRERRMENAFLDYDNALDDVMHCNITSCMQACGELGDVAGHCVSGCGGKFCWSYCVCPTLEVWPLKNAIDNRFVTNCDAKKCRSYCNLYDGEGSCQLEVINEFSGIRECDCI